MFINYCDVFKGRVIEVGILIESKLIFGHMLPSQCNFSYKANHDHRPDCKQYNRGIVQVSCLKLGVCYVSTFEAEEVVRDCVVCLISN